MSNPSNMLEVQKLSVNYGKMLALFEVTFTARCGEMVAIIGPNGAGKSTLLQAMLGIVKPFSGQVLFFQLPWKKAKKKIAYVPQKRAIDWNFPATVLDVALMGRYPFLRGLKWYRKQDRREAFYVLEKLGLKELSSQPISELSGGQQQRLFLVRALLQQADLLILDEPFVGVDKATEKLLIDILHKLVSEGKTVIAVHHDLPTTKNYFTRALLLKIALIADGDVEKVLTEGNLERAFGDTDTLLDTVSALSKQKNMGLV